MIVRVFFGALIFCNLLITPAARGAEIWFEDQVQPLLAKRCGKCHSAERQKGGLNLATMADLRRGGESGEPLVATIDDNLLWTLIDAGDMPPEGQTPLSDDERQLIRKWLESGARSKSAHEDRALHQHDILPIVLLRCVTCHGAQRTDGGLDLRDVKSMRRGGKSGPAFVAGDPDNSRMIQRIESQACPPRELLLKFFVRRPPTSEVRLLREWIAAGAHVEEIAPDVATTQPDPLVTDEDREHWAFQRLSRDRQFNGQSIDDFVGVQLKQSGLDFSPVADRDTLIRRVHLDLIGMPPTVQQWRHWRELKADHWYEQMVDALLASPHYGERWGRHWLDVAGYADSEGGVSSDPLRQVAWKYRDYVIRSFNEDKPYNRFLLEQIAGDELSEVHDATEVTAEVVDNLVATGFLRMGIDQTGSRTMNFVPERLGVISDAIRVLGSGVMGLTLECARCHSHKYDPIPHRDYYRFKAILQGALDEHDWLTFRNRSLEVGLAEHRERIAKINPPLLKREKQLTATIKKQESALTLLLLKEHYPDQSAADRAETLRSLKIADNNRTLPQRRLVEKLQRVEVLPDADQPSSVVTARKAIADLDVERLQVQRRMAPPLTIRALWDRGQPSPTYILRRGEYDKPGPLVGPGVPSALTDGRTPFTIEPPSRDSQPQKSQNALNLHGTGRRLALARWLTEPDHPLTTRVIVNRVWRHHFGAGIVRSVENFGLKGDPPSHPELLDWLAVGFVQQGWSIKQLHRLMLTSRTYRQASRVTERHLTLDPENRKLSRMPLRRLDAESLRDSLLSIAGRWEPAMGGPPDVIAVDRDGLVSVRPTARGLWRRSVYLQYRRTEIPTLMETFDYPEMGPNCVSRSISVVSPQALMLRNNEHIYELASSLAGQLAREGEPDASLVRDVYHRVLTRDPTAEELRLGVESLRALRRLSPDDRTLPLITYCHTLLNSAAFLYID